MRRSAGVAVLGAIITIAAGYLLQVGLGRAVIPAEFQFLQESLAFYMISMLPLQPIGAVVTKQSSRHDEGVWSILVQPWLIVFMLTVAATTFAMTSGGHARDWDAPTLILFALSVSTGIALVIANAVVIGRLDFVGSTVIQTMQASLRVGLGLPLVWCGTGGRGLWCATAIANGSAALCAKWRLSGMHVPRAPRPLTPLRTKRDLPIAMTCYAGVAVLTQIDLIYARRAFPAVQIYAGAALFGKLVFYLPAAASSVALPMLGAARTSVASARVLRDGVRLVSALAGGCFAGLALFGQFFAGNLLGEAYARSGGYIMLSAVAMVPYSLVSLFASASLDAGRIRLAFFSIVVASVIAAIALSGALSLSAMAAAVFVAGVVLAIVGWIDTRGPLPISPRIDYPRPP